MTVEAAGQSLAHHEVQGMFTLLLDEQLPEQEQEAVLAHLDTCASCESSFEKYSRAVTLVRNVERHRAPADFSHQVLKRVRRRRKRQLFGLQ
ncbi:MAG: anti-sigma factor family protein, partial [Myxococcales bacterium]